MEPKTGVDPRSLHENFVVAEILRQLTWSRTRAKPYHDRTHDGHEVDIVLEGPASRCVTLEVKATGTVRVADFTGLARLKEALGDRFVRGVLLHLGSSLHALPFGERLEALPVSALWQCPAR